MTLEAIVVTSIAGADHPILRQYALECARRDVHYIVIGDVKSPGDFRLHGCDFWSIARQRDLPFKAAALLPTSHYARKNLGYLIAIAGGARTIIETDDDNVPRDSFWNRRERSSRAARVTDQGWVNAYAYFTDVKIWPRGFPLPAVSKDSKQFERLAVSEVDCPIQQGLADKNPDVDAVYRLLLPLPQTFRSDRKIALGAGAWCPFNSQNTTWWPDAFPLLYLPAYCSFRMTDIWRSFVAQRIAWENGWSILFHEPTVWQERNQHDLMHDFEEEIPGYLLNDRIRETLERIDLRSGLSCIPDNLIKCYEALIMMGAMPARELPVLEAWLRDIAEILPKPLVVAV